MKKLNIGTLLVALLLFLSACGNQEQPTSSQAANADKPAAATTGRTLHIGYSSYTLRGPYFSAVDSAIKTLSNENGWTVSSIDAENRPDKQIADVEDLLTKKIDYLILNPKDSDAGVRIATAAKRAGVPVIVIDSDLSADAEVLTRVLAPNLTSNVGIGQYFAEQFGNERIVLGIIDGDKGNLVHLARRNGFIQGLINWQLDNLGKTNVSIEALLYTAADVEGGVRGTEDLVNAVKNINAIYVVTDDIARGAIRALDTAGLSNKVRVAGFDGSNEGIRLVKEKKYTATALNSPRFMVDQVFDVIKNYEAGQRVFPSVSSYEPVVITARNAAKYEGQGF